MASRSTFVSQLERHFSVYLRAGGKSAAGTDVVRQVPCERRSRSARHGTARHGKANQGKANQGKPRQGSSCTAAVCGWGQVQYGSTLHSFIHGHGARAGMQGDRLVEGHALRRAVGERRRGRRGLRRLGSRRRRHPCWPYHTPAAAKGGPCSRSPSPRLPCEKQRHTHSHIHLTWHCGASKPR